MAEQRNTAEALAALSGKLDMFFEVYDRDRADAKAVRDQINSSLNAIKAEATGVHHRVTKLEGQMVEANKVVLSVNDWRAQIRGGVIVLGLVGTVVGTMAWFIWQNLRDKFLSAMGGA